jgi:hypothetical protein
MPDLITDHERAYYPGAAQDALRQARQEIAELQDALDQAAADFIQCAAERDAARAALELTTGALEAVERHNPGGFVVGIAITQGRRVLDT